MDHDIPTFNRRKLLQISAAASLGSSLGFSETVSGVNSSSPDSWPMYQKNSENTGFNSQAYGPTEDPEAIWSIQKDSPFYAAPSVVDEMVYAVSGAGNVFAVEQQTGVIKWSENINKNGDQYSSPNVSSPAVAGDRIYIGSTDNRVYALSVEDGNLEWRIGTGNGITSSPTVDDGVVYIGSSDGKLYALNAENGSTEWAFNATDEIQSTPALSNSLVFIGVNASPYQEDNFFALRRSDGSIKWSLSTEGSITASATVSGDQVYIGDSRGVIYAVDSEDGTVRWKFSNTSGGVHSTIAADEEHIYTIGGRSVYCIDLTGQKKWEFSIGYNDYSDVAVSTEQVYVGKESTIMGINKSDGTSRWRIDTEGSVTGVPAVVGNSLFVGNENDTLLAISEPERETAAKSAQENENNENTTETGLNTSNPQRANQGSEPAGKVTQSQNSFTASERLGVVAIVSAIALLLGRVLDVPIKAHEVYKRFRRDDE